MRRYHSLTFFQQGRRKLPSMTPRKLPRKLLLIIYKAHSHYSLRNSIPVTSKINGCRKNIWRWLRKCCTSKFLQVINAYFSHLQVRFAYINTYQVFLSAAKAIAMLNTCCSIARVRNRQRSKTHNCFSSFFHSFL